MLDPVAAVGMDLVADRLLVAAQHLLDRRVADGVGGDLEAAGVVVRDVAVELLVAVDEDAEILGIVGIGRGHGRGLAAGRSVGEQLHRPGTHPLVAVAGHEVHVQDAVGPAGGPRQRHQIHALRQTALAAGEEIGLPVAVALAQTHSRIGAGGEAVGQVELRAGLDAVDEIVHARLRKGPVHELLGRLLHQAGQLAVLCLHMAAGRLGDALADLGQFQRLGIGHTHVAAGALDVDRVVRRHHVQLFAQRMALLGQIEVVIAAAHDPLARRQGLGPRLDRGQDVVDAGDVLALEVHLKRAHADGHHVLVRVVQTRHGQAAGEIDFLRVRTDQIGDFRRRAGGKDPSLPDRHRLGKSESGAKKDLSARQDGISGHPSHACIS